MKLAVVQMKFLSRNNRTLQTCRTVYKMTMFNGKKAIENMGMIIPFIYILVLLFSSFLAIKAFFISPPDPVFKNEINAYLDKNGHAEIHSKAVYIFSGVFSIAIIFFIHLRIRMKWKISLIQFQFYIDMSDQIYKNFPYGSKIKELGSRDMYIWVGRLTLAMFFVFSCAILIHEWHIYNSVFGIFGLK